MMNRTLLAAIISGLIFFIANVHAAGPPPEAQTRYPGAAGDWTVKIGAMGMYKPAYEGSDDYKSHGRPLIDIAWRDTFFLNPYKGLGGYFLNSNNMRLGASMAYAFGRDESDSNDLAGLGDIDAGATANALFEWKSQNLKFDARYQRQIIGEDTGFQAHARLGYRLRMGKKTMLMPSAQITFSDSEYMARYFSVSPAQSAASGHSEYDAGPGLKSIKIQIMAVHRLGRRWGAQVMASYALLIGDAADSPIVKNEGQCLFGVGLSYTF